MPTSRLSSAVAGILSVVAAACSAPHVSQLSSSRAVPVDDHSAHMSAADLAAPEAPRSSEARPGAVPSDASFSTAATETQAAPTLPPSSNTAPARLAGSPRHGEWVKIAWDEGSADSLMAWIVYPVSRAKAPVVVVVHEIFGLSTWVRGVADQLAADGFIAIAPDLLSRVRGGPSSTEMTGDSARRIIAGVNVAERNRGIVAAANYAMVQPAAEPRYAVIGFCWGGTATFGHAIHGGVQGFAGGVAYYGLPYMTGGQRATATTPAVPATFAADSLSKIRVPVMLLNGTGDARIAAAMPALDSTMRALGKTYTGTNYEGAIHGFLRAQDDARAPRGTEDQSAVDAERAANLAASGAAWPKTLAFLRAQLGVR